MALRSVWDAEERRDLVRRLRHIQPGDTPRWGRMTAPDMLAHLAITFRFGLGEAPSGMRRPAPAVLRLAPVKWFFIYVLPFPKDAPTPRGFIGRDDRPWDAQVDEVEALMERAAQRASTAAAEWPDHPFFGRLSRRAWGVLGYKHTDHHLRQFGV